jgi:hypothetical protein
VAPDFDGPDGEDQRQDKVDAQPELPEGEPGRVVHAAAGVEREGDEEGERLVEPDAEQAADQDGVEVGVRRVLERERV